MSIDRKEPHSFWKAVTSIRKDVSLQEIMDKQNYKPISYQEFRAKRDELVWEESLEELLNALN